VREAVLLTLSGTGAHHLERLVHLTRREWKELARWLDISGLALYFADRLSDLRLRRALPEDVQNRLQQNLADNTARTRSMIENSVSIQRAFQNAGISYSVLKGLSLFPLSVRRPELRHQLDLDFLVSEDTVDEACRILELRGYRLYAVSGMSYEFKRNAVPLMSMDDMYLDSPCSVVELHVEKRGTDGSSRLDRLEQRHLYGVRMPVLSPVDLFLSQGLHVFKDVCSAFLRTAHLLEFYWHVTARHDDEPFWRELRLRAVTDPKASMELGVVTCLISTILGDFAPESFKEWTVHALPRNVRLWIGLYARRTAFGQFPGTKVYLLLQKELELAGIVGRRPIKNLLLPTRLPPLIVRGMTGEKLSTRVLRYRLQVRYIVARLRFHILEGLRYLWESYKWRRRTRCPH
jgi:hypothetical protein